MEAPPVGLIEWMHFPLYRQIGNMNKTVMYDDR